jgi:hypothetical protein
MAKKKVTKKKAIRKRAPVKKRAAKKRRKKVAVNAPSRATKKAPSERLKKRRRKNTAVGYYPNPATRSVIAALIGNRVGYYTGKAFDTARSKALEFGDKGLVKTIARGLKAVKNVKAVGVFSSRDSDTTVKAAFSPK